MHIRLFALATALTLPNVAMAQVWDAPEREAHTLPAAFMTMDRMDNVSRAGFDLGFSFYDPDGINLGLRADLFGHLVTAQGWGGYVNVPISLLSYDTGLDESETEIAIGNIELGGTFGLNLQALRMIFRAGLVLPTAPDSLEGLVTNGLNVTGRITDVVTIAPDVTWLRVSASPIITSGGFFARADLGLDLPIIEGDNVDANAMARLNLGGGFAIPGFAIMGELVNNFVFDGAALHTLAVSARFPTGTIEPGISFVVPLDDDASIGDAVNFVLMGSLQFRLPTL